MGGYLGRTVLFGVSQEPDSEEYEYHIIHDSIGVSHILKRKKGVHPLIRCADCD